MFQAIYDAADIALYYWSSVLPWDAEGDLALARVIGF
jgi:hypothetical protein